MFGSVTSRMVMIQRRLQGAGQGHEWVTSVRLNVHRGRNAGSPTGRETYGDGLPIVVSGKESFLHGEGGEEDK